MSIKVLHQVQWRTPGGEWHDVHGAAFALRDTAVRVCNEARLDEQIAANEGRRHPVMCRWFRVVETRVWTG
jgi:hypothetical protein